MPPTDVLAVYADAARTVADLVARVGERGPGVWTTPALGEWDLRGLLGHTGRALSNVAAYAARPAGRVDIPSAEAYYALAPSATGEGADDAETAEIGRREGAALGGDPAGAFAALVARTLACLDGAEPGAVVATRAGGIGLGDYVATRTVELVVHGLDVAAASGTPVAFSPEALAASAGLLARTAAARGDGPLVLAALTGRCDPPPGFSAV